MKKRKIILKYITPSISSMLSVFLFTIIDGAFVGCGMGNNALGAVNIVFPYIMLFLALITMCSVGGMSIVAIRIGRKDSEGANCAFIKLFYIRFESIKSQNNVLQTNIITCDL